MPIQMKAASEACFSIDRKYSKFHDMLIAYVWNVAEPVRTKIYVLNQEEALRIATEMKYTMTEVGPARAPTLSLAPAGS